MAWTEILGFATGVLCVALLVRENIWSWPLGIANNVFYIVVFLASGLYADAGLQVFYIGISIYGWYQWLRGGRSGGRLQVQRVSRAQGFLLAGGGAFLTWLLWELLRRSTDSTVPFWDSLTTAMSLVAQLMLSRKLIENWWVWIAVDVIYIGLYTYKQLYLTSVLYFIFLCLCVAGLRLWRRPSATAAAAS